MHYIDGFVVPVPKKKLGAYRAMAQKFAKVCRRYGALKYVESVADDVQKGKWTSFPQSVKLKPGETVVFGYMVFKTRAHRNRAWEKIMKDPALKSLHGSKDRPFDGKRMFWGGFKAIVEA